MLLASHRVDGDGGRALVQQEGQDCGGARECAERGRNTRGWCSAGDVVSRDKRSGFVSAGTNPGGMAGDCGDGSGVHGRSHREHRHDKPDGWFGGRDDQTWRNKIPSVKLFASVLLLTPPGPYATMRLISSIPLLENATSQANPQTYNLSPLS